MAINFPDSPSLNDTHSVGSLSWTWDGSKWTINSSAGGGGGGGGAVDSVNSQTGAVVLDTDDIAEGTTNLYSQWSDVTGGVEYTGDVTITDTTADDLAGPEFSLYRNSASPADGDYLGQIRFDGKNDNGGDQLYAKITGKTSDVTLGTEDGLIEYAVVKDGIQTIVARQTGDALKLINGTGLEVAGNITVTGTVDGRDVAADGALAASAVQPGDLATVATSGSYNDLSNLPTLGTAAATASTDYATSAQGALADSATQPGDLASVATTGTFASLSDKTITVCDETVFNLTGTALDGGNGPIQYKTLGSNTTFTNSMSEGESITLMVDDGSAFTATWPTMTWVGGSAPTLPTTGYAIIELWVVNGTLYGVHAGDA